MTNTTALSTVISNDPCLLDFVALKHSIAKELKYIDGSYYCTIRGLSRLLDISPSSLTDSRRQVNGAPMGLLHKLKECSVEDLPQSLKAVAGFDFKNQPHVGTPNNYVDVLLPELVVSCITKYYAYDAQRIRTRAQQFDNFFSAVGVRKFFADILSPEPTLLTDVVSETEEVNTLDFDTRIAAVMNVMSVLKNASDEYKEKALLTLLGVI